MAKREILGDKKQKTVETKQLSIRGHLLQWEGVIIQISNISLITSADLNPPAFPLWSLIVILVGLFLFKYNWFLALIAIAVAGLAIAFWSSESERTSKHKYLNILLNSGFTYSILFSDEAFLNEVMSVFANIFEDDDKANTNYYIDINNSRISNSMISNDSSVTNA